MGLDIFVYLHLRELTVAEEVMLRLKDDCPRVIINPSNTASFAERTSDLEDRPYFADLERSWRAGSYSGYNNWREQLAKLIDTTCEEVWKSDSGPFYELINFSDCEGTLGPRVCAKLAQDFITYDKKAKRRGKDFYANYKDFKEAFIACGEQNGVVIFS